MKSVKQNSLKILKFLAVTYQLLEMLEYFVVKAAILWNSQNSVFASALFA